jgi:hypothetical protein
MKKCIKGSRRTNNKTSNRGMVSLFKIITWKTQKQLGHSLEKNKKKRVCVNAHGINPAFNLKQWQNFIIIMYFITNLMLQIFSNKLDKLL